MIQETYCDIEITYNEKDDQWECEIRGRFRSFDSLKKAKESIDREPAEKKKKMEPIPAYYLAWGGKLQECIVTSFDTGYGGRLEAWINLNGKRSKEQVSQLVIKNDFNLSVYKEIQNLIEEKNALDEKISEAKGKYQHVTEVKL